MPLPPIRPGRLTRVANGLGLRRSELVAGIIATVIGAPIAGTVVLLATVPVPQTPGHPFSPAAPTTIAAPAAADPSEAAPSPHPVPAPTVPRVAPKVIAPTRAPAPTRTSTAPATTAQDGPDALAGLLCPALIRLGHANIPRGDPLYTAARDRGGNGIACESDDGDDGAPTTTAPTKDPVPTVVPDPPPTGAAGGQGGGAEVP